MEKILCFFVLAICSASAIYHQPDSRIAGGYFARENEFPFAVSLQQINLTNTASRGHRCGGVLISRSYVLTTASCTFLNYNDILTPIVPHEHRVFAGSIDLSNNTTPELYRQVFNVTRHPEYTGPPAFANDIAIIGLNNPFTISSVSPLAIPPAGFQHGEGSLCVVVGWGGANSAQSVSVQLKYARKYISDHRICTLQYALIPATPNVLPSMVCAQSYDIISTGCHGDYGNGLICNGGLAGILSLSNGCLPTAYPELYTRVANYSTWIRSVTGGASTFQPGVAVLIMLAVVQLITAKIIS